MEEKRLKVKVVEITDEAGKVKTFRFEPTDDRLPEWTAGQFVLLHLKLGDEDITRAYSISSSPLDKGYIELTLELTPDGKLTPHFHKKVEIGDEFEMTLPKGHFTYTEDMGDSIVLIAGGSGVVPFRAISRYCTQKKLDTKITLIYSIKTESRIIFRKELDELAAQNPNFRIIYTLTREVPENRTHNSGRINREFLEDNVNLNSIFYICGPIPLVRDVGNMLKELGIDRTRIKRDVWGA